MSYETFISLVVLINRNTYMDLESKELMKLSVTLRYLAGGSYLDISVAHHLPTSSIFKIMDETITRIDSALKIEFHYDNDSHLQGISQQFTRGGISPLSNCCGAIDGIAIKINEPSARDVANSSTYYNRKGWFALNLQAMCDSFYRFTFLSCIAPGSTHDSTAYAMSSLSRLLSRETNTLLPGYWIVADDAYICRNRLLTPWPGRNLSVEKDAYNYWQSSSRIFIEQAFGMLIGRWGVFWRQLRCSLNKNCKIVIVCCKLHNFIIEKGESLCVPPPSQFDVQLHSDNPEYEVHLQDRCDTELNIHRRRRDLESSTIRDELTNMIHHLGLRRP